MTVRAFWVGIIGTRRKSTFPYGYLKLELRVRRMSTNKEKEGRDESGMRVRLGASEFHLANIKNGKKKKVDDK